MKGIYKQFEGRGQDTLLHRNLRVCTEEGIFATPFVVMTVPGNVFIAALLTTVLGINESLYGWIVSLPAWANAIQVLLVPLVARFYSARLLTIGFSILNMVVWLSLLLFLNYLPTDNPEAVGRLMLAYFAVISLSQSMAGVSWMSWIQEWIPERLRGKYFGSRNRIMGLVTVGFILITGGIFSRFGESMLAFQIILGATCAMRILSIYLLTHIYTPWSHPEKMIHEDWAKQYRELISNGPFRTYLIYAACLAFCFSITGPFAPIFMTEHLGFSVSRQTYLLVLGSLASAFTMPIWGRLCDRHGCRPIILGSGICWMIVTYAWAFLTPALTWMLYPMWVVGGALSGGVLLGGFNLVLKLTPITLKSTGISLHLGMTSLAAAFAPILVGWLLSTELLSAFTVAMRYRFLFFLQPTLVIASFLILAKVKEPKAAELTAFSGAFRTMRHILVQNGFFVVGNLTFIRRITVGVTSVIGKKKTGDDNATDLERKKEP